MDLYLGSALCEVTPAGELLLPDFVRNAASMRTPERRQFFIGLHEEAPCLVAFDQAYLEALSVQGDAAQRRRGYGFVERASYDWHGRLRLPSLIRERGGITRLALLVATGDRFEIWNPAMALAAGDPDLRALAALHFKQFNHKEDQDEPFLPLPPARAEHADLESGAVVQHLPPLRHRAAPLRRSAAGGRVAARAGRVPGHLA